MSEPAMTREEAAKELETLMGMMSEGCWYLPLRMAIEALRREERLLEIISDLVAYGPSDENGYCRYCGSDQFRRDTHNIDCAFDAGKLALKPPQEHDADAAKD